MNQLSTQLQQRSDRVRDHSAQKVNENIAMMTRAHAEESVRQGPQAIVRRLTELDHEWDIDRVLMANFAVAGGVAYTFGLARPRRPFARSSNGFTTLLGVQLGFLLLHATLGWCPPMALWRRLGVRSKAEIEGERSFLLEALAEQTRREAGLGAEAGLTSRDAVINQ